MDRTIYLDNAATTYPKPQQVYDYADSFYRECGVNAGRGSYPLAARASGLIGETRKQCAELFHIGRKKQVAFSSSATEAINTVLQGLDYSGVKNVYITPFEHNAVLRCVYYLQGLHKFNVITLPVQRSHLQYDIERIEKQFRINPPGIVVITHASNVCGLVAPFAEIFTLAKKYGAATLLDMSQTAGLIDTDLSGGHVDYAVFAGHKTLYAPFGVAGMILKNTAKLKPLIYGGTRFGSASEQMPDTLPESLEAGSPNIYAIAGLSAALGWIKDTGIDAIRQRETALTDSLKAMLKSYPNIHIIGENDGVSIVSCTFDGYASDDIGYILSSLGIAVRTGIHCAPAAHKFFGTLPGGTVRFSLGYFNTEDDIWRLRVALDEIHSDCSL
jgi:cysteine desulfurase family protein